MKATTQVIFDELFVRYPNLNEQKENVLKAYLLLEETFKNGGSLFICGNGGSAADSEHIVGELLKSFKMHRAIDKNVAEKLMQSGEEGAYLLEKLEGALPAYSLNSQVSILTAFANDKSWDTSYAQQLYGLGKKGDCLIALSTSGNSKNCEYCTYLAKAKDIKSISLTGVGGGKLASCSDCIIAVPETETYKVQELHLPIYHCLCAMLENEFFGV